MICAMKLDITEHLIFLWLIKGIILTDVSQAQQVSFISEPSNTTLCLAQSTMTRFSCVINRGSNVNVNSIGWYISVGGGEFESVEGRPRHIIDSVIAGNIIITGTLVVIDVSVNDDGTRYRCQPNNSNLISNVVTLSVLASPAIDSVTVDETCSNDFTVSWTATSDDIRLSYNVTLSSPSRVALITTMDNSYNFTGLMRNTTYNITIRAREILQCFGAPTTMMITTPTSGPVVQNISMLRIVSRTNTSITVMWSPEENSMCGPAMCYSVTIMNSSYMYATKTCETTFEFLDLMSDTSYNITVRVINRAGIGPASDITLTTLRDDEEANRTTDPPATDPTNNGTNNGDGDDDGGLSDGDIAGISIGSIVFVVVVVGSSGAVYYCVCWKKDGKISCLVKDDQQQKPPKSENTTEYAELALGASGAPPPADPTKVSYTAVTEHEPLGYVEVQHEPGASDKPIRGAGQVEYKEIMHQ